jgi:hypothetical protein
MKDLYTYVQSVMKIHTANCKNKIWNVTENFYRCKTPLRFDNICRFNNCPKVTEEIRKEKLIRQLNKI